MIAQIINLNDPKLFDKYRVRYNLSWSQYYNGLQALELRKIKDNFFQPIKKILEKTVNNVSFLEIPLDNSRAILLGNLVHFRQAAEQLSEKKDLFLVLDKAINNYENYNSVSYQIKGKQFDFNTPHVMGILNVTPDSFSDGGIYINTQKAAEHGIYMIDKGVDIVDIGGESTRPGSESISAEEEEARVLPVIQRIIFERPSAIISIDTTKNIIASKALQLGAAIVNDISGLQKDIKIAETVKKFNASLIIMHMKGTPKSMQNNPEYDDVIEEVYDFLFEKTALAESFGISNILIDPGIGFGKKLEHNLEIIRRLSDFKSLGYPILIGLSRKSFLGKILDVEITERDIPTAITEAIAVSNGARIIRTHNIDYGIQVSKLLTALI